MKNMRRFLSLMLAMMLCLGAFSMTALAVNPFTDVPTTEWYYSDIDHAYQMELINGKTPTLFMPNDYLTYAEAVKLAACMNQRYTTGSVTLENGEPWYQTYVDYCKEEGIISKDYSWNASATRAGYMEIFADALPDAAMKEINDIPGGSIPDVPTSHPQAAPIYKLYRVGILQGNDLAHNCNPAANIKRAEVAAILTRMMDSSKRIRFTMGEETEKEPEKTEPLKIVTQPEDTTVKAGETAYMTVKAAGGEKPYEYQWLISFDGERKQWDKAPGQTSATLSVTTSETNSRLSPVYRCMVTDKNGDVVYSDLASITVEQKQEEEKTAPLKIITQPESVRAAVGDAPYFEIEVTGGKAPYSFAWFIGEEGGGRTVRDVYGIQTKDQPSYGYSEMQVLITENFEYSEADRYFFYCDVTDANGDHVRSNAFDITVEASKDQPFKVTYEAPQYVKADASEVDLIINVSGGKAPYTFIWMGYPDKYGPTTDVENWDGIQIGRGKTGSSLTVNPKVCSCTHYICRVEDSAGNFEIVDITFTIR